MNRILVINLLIACALRSPAAGQRPAQQASDSTPPVARPLWEVDRFVSSRFAVTFELDREVPTTDRLALVIANTDVSAATALEGRRLRYRPTTWRLPSGASEAVAYLVRAAGQWIEIGRAPLKVLTRAGLERGSIVPSLDLSSTGQLDQSIDPGSPPARRTYQDLTLRIGVENTVAKNGWEFAARGNAVGVSETEQRLRYGQPSAPAVDLSDYRIQLSRRSARLTMGHVAVGANRYLMSGFSSRGLAAGLPLGSAATLDLGLVRGSSVVGWNNLLGLMEPDHRIAVGTLGVEVFPKRPGGLHLDVSGIDGSVLPQGGYNQGAATDAEESRGFGVQVSASDVKDRVRFSGGVARSRFVNPGDPLLFGDTTVVAVAPTTRTARYGELGLQFLRGVSLGKTTQASLGATLRHERVDPLFRSVGGSPQSDVENNGLELTGAIGPLSFQATATAARDNLGRIASILTSRTRTRGVNLAAPLGALLGAPPEAWYLPALTYSWQRTRQYGEGVPTNGDFSAGHVPDQWSIAQAGSAAWTGTRWSLSYRWNQSSQDNRQTGRERADFRGIVHGLSFALTGITGFTPSLETSVERQKNFESALTQRTERVGASAAAQLTRTTAFNGSLSQAWGFDPFGGRRTRNTEVQVELSQGLNLYRATAGGTQARLFVRYARARAAFLPIVATPGVAPAVRWTLNAGGSIRLY
ncbi:MAG: hypothetical protein ACKVZ0_14005 [Gemmatimonadales bacterium]